jgi:hypothetical protein
MIAWDAIGYLASALVLAAFCMKEMIALRFVAVCSNIAFLAYGLALGLVPVWSLHAILLPINCWRLWEGLLQPPPVLSVLKTARWEAEHPTDK